jgi:citrate synthase
MSREWISRAEALRLLDVKPQTLYAYVSRQRIAARADPDHPRMSLYALDDVERLSKRAPGRVAQNAPVPEPVRVLTGGLLVRGEAAIDSEITLMLDGNVYYRGKDSAVLAETETLETVSALLWQSDHPNPFGALKPRPDVNFPGGPRTRALHMLSRRLEEDALTEIKPNRPLVVEAAGVLNELVDAITNGGPRLYFHQRLGRSWKVYDPKDVDLIRRALVLCADNGLDDATLAARVAASSHGPLSIAVMAGFATVTGPKLGGRIARAEAFVTQALRMGNAALVAKTLLNQGSELPGFESATSGAEIARAKILLDAAPQLGADLKAIGTIGEDICGRPIGLSLALALIGRHLDLPRDAPLTLYGVARTSGWLAHAMEQIQSGLALKARLRYIGNDPLR